jgi:pyruvate,orthophosphate dikinase
MSIDAVARSLTLPDGLRLQEGSLVSVDGGTGRIYEGGRESQPSPVATALQGSPGGPTPKDPTVRSVLRLLEHADSRRRLEVHANAETPEEARIARRLGAQGVGLCRTENLLLGPRRELMERLVTGEKREGALEEIEAFTYTEFTAILEAMDGLPVVVRLLDPPLHEFLPDLVDLSVQMALAQERGDADEGQLRRLLAVQSLHETNPLLGLRGVRILTVLPQIADVQVRALARATVALRTRGLHPEPEIMIPLVADLAELEVARSRVERVVGEVARAHAVRLDLPVGVMIELPRAALTASALATAANFFSFGTNDLTQTCWGISRDDAEASFLRAYRAAGILTWDPFVTIDEQGVGRLVELAAQEGRAARPTLRMGACGRHAEDPGSVGFFARVGLDYLSCSALRIPVIRLEAGRQAVTDGSAPAASRSSDEGE